MRNGYGNEYVNFCLFLTCPDGFFVCRLSGCICEAFLFAQLGRENPWIGNLVWLISSRLLRFPIPSITSIDLSRLLLISRAIRCTLTHILFLYLLSVCISHTLGKRWNVHFLPGIWVWDSNKLQLKEEKIPTACIAALDFYCYEPFPIYAI